MNHRVVWSAIACVAAILLVAGLAVLRRPAPRISGGASAVAGPVATPTFATLAERRNWRFRAMTGDHEFNSDQPGEYLPIKADNTAAIVKDIPVEFLGDVPADQKERLTGVVKNLGQAIVEALGLEDFQRITAMNIDANVSDPFGGPQSKRMFDSTLRFFMDQVTNYSWESVNTSASRFRVADLATFDIQDCDLKWYDHGRPFLKDRRQGTYLLALRFQVGHWRQGKNFLEFGFFMDEQGRLIHLSVIGCNFRSIGPAPTPLREWNEPTT